MKIVFTIIIISTFFCYNIQAQTRTDNWVFGKNAGINISALDQTETVLKDLNIYALAAASSISDTNGELKLYTNGSVSVDQFNNFISTSRGIGGEFDKAQSTIIIPKYNNPNIYYIFSTREKSSPNIFDPISPGFYYSEVDVSTNTIVTSRTQLIDTATSKVTAVHHEDGKSIWLVVLGLHTFDGDKTPSRAFFTFNISEKGIDSEIITKQLRSDTLPKNGAMKISPDGTKIAYTSLDDGLSLHNFNAFNGTISDIQTIPKINPIKKYDVFGLEFSASTKYIYTTSRDEDGYSYVHQYNLTSENTLRKHYEVYKSPTTNSNYGALQIASNKKIYHSINFGNGIDDYSNFLGVIEEPEKEVPDANYIHNKIDLGEGKSHLGLPSFIQSYFNTNISTTEGCVSLPTTFVVDAYTTVDDGIWDFGDGTTGTGASPSHTYTAAGKYQVSAIVSYDNQKLKISKEIEIFPLPEVISNQKLIQCDADGSGTAFYNLNEIAPLIVTDTTDKRFTFYENETDAINDTNNITKPNQYQNKSINQEIFVRVIDIKGCYSITSFFLETTFIELDPITTLYTCNNLQNDNTGTFLLDEKEIDIRNELNIANSSSLRFFNSFIEAQTLTNELPDSFVAESQKIWIRIDTNLGCGGISSFEAVVNPEPIINLQDSYTICFNPNLKPPVIISADASNDTFEWRDHTGNIISRKKDFTLNSVGDFSLTVYKTENNLRCNSVKNFTVINPDAPTFSSIDVNTEDETNNIVDVFIDGNSNYEFSLDNVNFFGNNTSYTFTNVDPGLRTVYIRDINNCEQPIQTNVSVIGFKKYFTPNGDGDNDYWNIKGLDPAFFKSVKVHIFDRYGKVIGAITDFSSLGWDGTFNGKLLPSNNYWFIAEIVDIDDNLIKETGNFSLIRN